MGLGSQDRNAQTAQLVFLVDEATRGSCRRSGGGIRRETARLGIARMLLPRAWQCRDRRALPSTALSKDDAKGASSVATLPLLLSGEPPGNQIANSQTSKSSPPPVLRRSTGTNARLIFLRAGARCCRFHSLTLKKTPPDLRWAALIPRETP